MQLTVHPNTPFCLRNTEMMGGRGLLWHDIPALIFPNLPRIITLSWAPAPPRNAAIHPQNLRLQSSPFVFHEAYMSRYTNALSMALKCNGYE